MRHERLTLRRAQSILTAVVDDDPDSEDNKRLMKRLQLSSSKGLTAAAARSSVYYEHADEVREYPHEANSNHTTNSNPVSHRRSIQETCSSRRAGSARTRSAPTPST